MCAVEYSLFMEYFIQHLSLHRIYFSMKKYKCPEGNRIRESPDQFEIPQDYLILPGFAMRAHTIAEIK